MLIVENISYAIGDRQVLESVSFSLMPGNKVALVGENGAGKSTLLKIVMGEISSDEGSVVKPNSVGYVPQIIIDEPSVLEGITVLDFMLEGRGLNELSQKMRETSEAMNSRLSAKNLQIILDDYSAAQEKFISLGGYEAESEVSTVLNGVGLHVNTDAEVRKLSGGEKTRLAFARSIFADCELLILDEPTNHIDRQYYGWLGNYLKRTSKTVLVVSHHPEFIDPFTQRIIEIEKMTGRCREYQGTYESYLEQSSINEKTLIRQIDWLNTEINRLTISAQRLQHGGPNRATAAQSTFKRIDRMEKEKGNLASNLAQKEKPLRFKFPISRQSGKLVIQAQGLGKTFSKKVLFNNISFDIVKGERVIISGPNGSGKTTLLRIVMGLISPDKGNVKFGYNVQLGYYAQEHENLNLESSVISEAQSAGIGFSGNLRNVLARFLFFQDKVFQKVETLSLGEKSRLSLCKLMLSGNNLLVLDEPTNYLDPVSRNSVAEALQDYEGTVVFVSHDREFIKLVNPNRSITLPEGIVSDYLSL